MRAVHIALTGDKSSSEGTHDTCDIRSYSMTSGDTFKASKNRIIVEGTTLYNDVLAKFGSVRNLDNLIR